MTLTSIGDGVIATDEQGNVTFVNPVAERLTGRNLAQAKGKAITEVFPIFNELHASAGGQSGKEGDGVRAASLDWRTTPSSSIATGR